MIINHEHPLTRAPQLLLEYRACSYKDPCTNARTLGVNVHARVSPRMRTFKPRALVCVYGSSQKIL